jgi:anti-sigma regulatory factor (Ser/Thr protein kinase)
MEPLTVSGTLDSLGAIAQYVITAATAAGLDKKSTYRLRLAVDEIATNIIVHGYEESDLSGNIVIHTSLDNQALTVVLEDTAERYNPTQRAIPDDMDKPLEERKIGGLGVYLTMQGVDQFLYERVGDRNRNILIVNRPAAG